MIAAGTVEEKTYEKQIHKDGIRRTVFTTGATVQRYFEKNELRKLLTLAPAGVCETMEKVQEIETDWSRHQHILSHFGVVGLSRHDGFYQPETDDAEGPQSAFPAVSTPGTELLSMSGRILKRSNDHKVESWRRESGSDSEIEVIKVLTEQSSPRRFSNREKSGDDKENVFSAPIVLDSFASESSEFEVSSTIAEVMQRAEQATKAGFPMLALGMLMDVLDHRYDEVDGTIKLDFHTQIAILVGSLGLLDTPISERY